MTCREYSSRVPTCRVRFHEASMKKKARRYIFKGNAKDGPQLATMWLPVRAQLKIFVLRYSVPGVDNSKWCKSHIGPPPPPICLEPQKNESLL